MPLPHNPDYAYALAAPKTDHHPKVRPYSQPTQANMFPFFLTELKSEAGGGTLYEAEGQLATSGVHRVSCCQPKAGRRARSFVHVHYFNPEVNEFYMSWLDSFTYAKDGIQECHDFVKNVIEWTVSIQQPTVKDAMDKLHPITRLRKKRGATGPAVDGAESSTNFNLRNIGQGSWDFDILLSYARHRNAGAGRRCTRARE
ncbi:hypothetical protein BDY21DRAFT_367701 [Lineolata rhizophorae]|uniref:Uncharacterized protein n=1 Tax=Lineolata rhizophorae TaxID=578093 RepID=A0A6A6NMT1_9PEZI|nr:hypothetical protein BDY21DRAFT_367701 [Lineolata rhizophorae]